MLTIRDEQMTTLKRAAWLSFQEKMVRRFETQLPRRFTQLGEPEVRRIAGKSIEKGIQYDFSSQDDIVRLAELMVESAPDLDTAPRFAWARELLGQRDLSSRNRLAILAYRMGGPTPEN
jgi:hypothetical protein